MGKFPEADAEIAKIQICLRCKARVPITLKKCRKCGSEYLRPKRKALKSKK